MNSQPAFAEAASTAPPGEGRDVYSPVLEDQITKLGMLVDLGLEAAQIITGWMRTAPNPAAPSPAPAKAPPNASEEAPAQAPPRVQRLGLDLARVSQVACLCMAVQARLIGELRDPQSHPHRAAPRGRGAGRAAPAAPAAPTGAPVSLDQARRDVVAEAIEQMALAAHRDDGDAVDRTVYDAKNLLRLDSRFFDMTRRPVSESIALACRTLGLDPDWPSVVDKALGRDALARTHPDAPPAFRVVVVRPPPVEHPLERADRAAAPHDAEARDGGSEDHGSADDWPPEERCVQVRIAPDPPPTPVQPSPYDGPHCLPGELPPRPQRRRKPYWE